MDMKRDIDLPWRVIACKDEFDSSFVKGFKEKSDAEASAQERNRRAEAMDIPTRYRAVTTIAHLHKRKTAEEAAKSEA